MRLRSDLRRALLLVLAASLLAACCSTAADAQLCGDADANGQLTVTDGVQMLRAAAGLSSDCDGSLCDADDNGNVTVTDGVAVLRAAAKLPANLECGRDPFVNSVNDGHGVFGPLTTIPGGLEEPPGAQATVTNVEGVEQFAAGRTMSVTLSYDVGLTAAAAEPTDLDLLVATAPAGANAVPSKAFALPLTSAQGTVTLALNVRDDIPVQSFEIQIANGSGNRAVSRIEHFTIIVIRSIAPACGNRTLDGSETCDPPGAECAVSGSTGFCTDECTCQLFPGPTPVPGSLVDNRDGTVTDTATGLQWERKTSAVGSGPNDQDPHDVDNLYQWCVDANVDHQCDGGEGPADGSLFTDFLRRLNEPPCFAGHCDWRIPTVNRDGDPSELGTIVDLGAPGCGAGSPCIDPAFGATAPIFYWSNTTNTTLRYSARVVDFGDNGTVLNGAKSNFAFARAVRRAFPVATPTPNPGRFVDEGETVIDEESGLEWEKKTSILGSGQNLGDPHDVDNLYQWCADNDANEACDGGPGPADGPLFTDFLSKLNSPPCFAGHCDWRIPRVNEAGDPQELETIVDRSVPECGAGSPCVDAPFVPTRPIFYWSETENLSRPDSAFVVDFSTGNIFNGQKFRFAAARAVRTR